MKQLFEGEIYFPGGATFSRRNILSLRSNFLEEKWTKLPHVKRDLKCLRFLGQK
jgi:hypothetical protein